MKTMLFLATSTGLETLQDDDDSWRETTRGLAGHNVTSVIAREGVILAGTTDGVFRSDDLGGTWHAASAGLIHHHVRWRAYHPDISDFEFVGTEPAAIFISRDGGASWPRRYICYCRAAWIDPADPDHLILGPADSVDRNGRIEESHDGGRIWTAASSGLDVPWRRHMVERFTQAGDELLAILSNGELLAAPLATLEWRRILPADAGGASVAIMA